MTQHGAISAASESLRGFRILLLLAASMVAASHAQNPGPPNVLVLMAEDLSSRIGAFDDPLARTPNIDRLALEGVRFPNTFTTAGVCAPSRAAFITGMHAISIGAMHMRTSTSPVAPYLTVPPPRIKAFPELLRAAGYHTFTDRKLDYQFSGILAGSGPSTIWDAEGQGDHLARVPPDRPFFGLINFLITHESAAFLEASVGTDRGRQTARAAARARANLDRRTPPDRISVPPYYPDLPEVRAHIADHYDNIQLMDAQVGEIIAALAARGQLERTILIWTTDHGDPLPRAKRELYDSGIRVPLIVRWPEAYRPDHLAPGAVDERLISFVDLAPTILRLAGISPPTHLHGRDILDPDVPARRYVYAARDRIDEQPDRVRAVRDHRFKYLRFFRPGTPGAVHLDYRDQGRIMRALWEQQSRGMLNAAQAGWFLPRPEEALFDLSQDPHELHNLAQNPVHAQALTRMRSAYAAWRLRVADLGALSEATLAERFWPGGRQPLTSAPTIRPHPSGHIELHAEPGASIEYRLNEGPWQIYSGNPVTPTHTVLRARAVRYGYALSAEVSFPVMAMPPPTAAGADADPVTP